MDTKGIIYFHDLSGSRNNMQSKSRNSNIYQKLPYDNAAIPVKQIDAFKCRPEIIHTGRVTVQVSRACWIL
jgi:hypothetical protein